jgi:hypothetical protein
VPKHGARVPADFALAISDLVRDRKAPWNDAPRRSSVITGGTCYPICRRPPSTCDRP